MVENTPDAEYEHFDQLMKRMEKLDQKELVTLLGIALARLRLACTEHRGEYYLAMAATCTLAKHYKLPYMVLVDTASREKGQEA